VSVLVVEPDDTNGSAVVRLLISEGDDVGVIVADPGAREKWKAMGAHVAVGLADDPDLIERAAQHARSIVLFDAPQDVVDAVIEGARMASSSPARILYCATAERHVRSGLEESKLEFVIIAIPWESVGLRRRKRQTVEPRAVAEAVSAADDLAEERRLVLDLNTVEARDLLGIRN
jgi:CheY-like chemotaxis protein